MRILPPEKSGGEQGRRRRLRAPAALLAAVVLSVPFGSLGKLQQRIVNGSLSDRVLLGKVLRGHCNDTARIAYLVGALKRRPPQRPTVYLLGGSGIRESIPTTGRLETAIRRRSGVDSRVEMLASSEQKLSAMLAIIDNLPAGKGGVIVIGLHHTPFCYGTGGAVRQLHGNEILAGSATLRDFVQRRLGVTESTSLLPGIKLYLAEYRENRGVSAFRGAWLDYHLHRYSQRVLWSRTKKLARVHLWRTGRGRPGGPFYTYFDFNAALLEECVKTAQAKGFQVLLMEDSQDAAIVRDAFDKYKEKYRAVFGRLVATYGIHYVNCNRTAGLADRDFHDLIHLVPSGRAKWLPELAHALAQIYRDHPAKVSPQARAAGPTERER